ncbi:unnamed protein product [Gordionus sp. m RMFG-2023]
MPMLGLGTYKITEKEEMFKVFKYALECGYRAFDTAQMYGNEEIIGETLEELLPKFNLKRADVFITSKLMTDQHGDKAAAAIDETLRKLRTDYIDLFLIHWPYVDGLERSDLKNGEIRASSWKFLEKACIAGKIKSIGVSNYTIKHLDEMLKDGSPYKARIRPAIDQVEFHPYLYQKEMLDYCDENGMTLEGYSPLGSPKSKDILEEEVIKNLAKKYSKQPAQIVLRWEIQHDVIVIPKSANPERIKANIEVFDFSLSPAEMESINALNKNKHYASDPVDIA